MKKILIISPHYPPSNLSSVHRTRLFAKHLPSFGWEPIILTVHQNFYEESLDYNLEQILPQQQKIVKVNAFGISSPRLIGDIGIRAFFHLREKALELVRLERIDFVYIPIPSFYVSLIGPYLYRKTGVKYGIDYIDPWVHIFPGSEKIFSRHWFSTQFAKILEPIAVRYASLITGVAESYYKGVINRNPKLIQTSIFGAMPYGGEEEDHISISKINLKPYLFEINDKFKFVYAGAMLPRAYILLDQIFKAIYNTPKLFENFEFHFIGTGKSPNDNHGYNIRPLAEKYGLWNSTVFEYPKRIPYLDVLIHLDAANSVFILGSTEPHYTPSKVYQGVLSKKPLLSILHEESTAAKVIQDTRAGLVFTFNEQVISTINLSFTEFFKSFIQFFNEFKFENVQMLAFEPYSAKSVTYELSQLLNKATSTS